MRKPGAKEGGSDLGHILRGSREADISCFHWKKEGKAGHGKCFQSIDLCASIRSYKRETGVSRGAEDSGKDPCVRSILVGELRREGDGDEYLELVKCGGVREILVIVLRAPFHGSEPPKQHQ